jgi:hypothetical protein
MSKNIDFGKNQEKAYQTIAKKVDTSFTVDQKLNILLDANIKAFNHLVFDFLKTTDYSLSDVVEKEGLEKPYIVKAGAFNFSFSSVGGDSWDIPTTFFNDFKIYENDALVLGSGNDDGSWVIGISNVNYKNKSYYMVETYSGGAHCCIDRYPIVISGESIKMNKTIDTGDVGGMGFFEKDGEVYVWMVNTDFSYFLISYSASSIMTYPNFYKFDKNTGVLIQVDEEFEEYYKKFINTQTAVIEQFKTSNYSKDAGDIWPAFLSARAVYQLKAGQDRGDVMKQFDADFKILDAKYPRSGSSDGKLEEIKSDILKRVFP